MTNTQTIEKLNEALNQLIDAYETLQGKNNDLQDEIESLKNEKLDLEYKVTNFSSDNEVQEIKIDGMLNKIKGLLKPTNIEINDNITNENIESKEEEEDSIFDIKLDEPNENDDNKESTTKIDLGRMESLLNGLNNR